MVAKQIMSDIRALAALYRPTWADISAAIERQGVPTMEVKDRTASDKLKDIEKQLAEKRAELPKLTEERDKARDTYANQENVLPGTPEFEAAEEAVRNLGECEDQIEQLQQAQTGVLKMLGRDDRNLGRGQDRAAGDPSDPRGWSSARLFEGDGGQQLIETLGQIATTKSRTGSMRIGEVIGRDDLRDMLAADVAPSTDQRRGNWLGVIPQLRRTLRVLDLIPTGTMDNETLPYTRESGSFTTAKPVKEGEVKPESGVTFTDALAEARTIAHWMKIRKQALADVSALRSIIDSRLRYGVERILEAEALAGKGTDPELEGILHATGIGVTAFKADVTGGADQVLRAITSILLENAQATGIVMNPLDWQEVLLAKAAGDGHYFSGGPFQVTPQLLWGVPLVASPSIPQSVPLVGDFEIGAQLFIREGVNVLMSDSDGEDFIKNRITMLGEMRAAMAVFRPSVFQKAYLTKAAEEAGL